VVCVSDENRRRFVEDHRFPAHKVITIWHGIDAQRFRPDPSHGEAWRRRWNLPSGALVFGALGRFAAQKGYDTALAAFEMVLARFPNRDLRLVVVGEGPLESALRTEPNRSNRWGG